MRIGQATDVEDEVGVERQAVLEAEGLEHQRQALAGLAFYELAHPFPQGAGLQAAGVDAVAETGDRRQQFALQADRFGQRAFVVGQRMAASRFGIALEQRFLVGVQEQEGDLHTILAQSLEFAGQQFNAAAGAGIDGNRHLADLFFLQHADQHGQNDNRQVVDAVIARVFKQVEGDGLAGAGKSADQYEFHGRQDKGRRRRAATFNGCP
ncbi:hypothetical protein SDC9_169392 [bioreactor metagenome]|uniref:Uncharacterized protein n=1 Tax=bioreactor metagenome TaxID=1076179 RepID=A0A645G891_9ZZZZ